MAFLGRSQLLALALAIGATGWILSGQFGEPSDHADAAPSPDESASAEPAKKTISVRVRVFEETAYRSDLILNGRTRADRSVTLKAQIGGPVEALPMAEGDSVATGDILVRLAREDRDAQLASARAEVTQRRIEQRASSKLQRKGFTAETQLAAANAALRQAEANLAVASLNVARTVITAPFDGVLEERAVEVGDYLQVGDPVVTVIDLDPIVVVAPATERDLSRIRQGQPGSLRLLDGTEAPGTVSFVSRSGDAETRTFEIELSVPNTDGAISANQTAELILPQRAVSAHQLRSSMLALSDAGVLGVKAVDDTNIVRFLPVDILAETPDGIWVAGLPASSRLITVGQAFVRAGEEVVPVLEGERPAAPRGQPTADPVADPTAGSRAPAAGDAG